MKFILNIQEQLGFIHHQEIYHLFSNKKTARKGSLQNVYLKVINF